MVDETVHPSLDPGGKPRPAELVDQCCDRFEAEWKAGSAPRIEDYLADWQGDPAALLAELLVVEIELRHRSGPEPSLAEYLQRFPQHEQVVRSAASSAETVERTGLGTNAENRPGNRTAPIVRCPECNVQVDTSHAQGDEVTCPACGHLFRPASAASKPFVPKQIAHFELIEQIGAGAFGAVWKVRDTMLHRIAAIKIPRQAQLDAQGIEKFLREARAAAQLKHPNIVSVHEVGRDGETAYIVSDFIPGSSLDRWLENHALTNAAAAVLCRKIASALHHAHEAGVIHRDLKPSNIMIDQAGEPHVMDFGLAKRDAVEHTMTMEGQILGTPAYMAPEQARGESHTADRRSDVYSLGVVLYELLVGERPFRGNLQVVIKQVLEDRPVPPRRRDATIARDLETICMKCLEKDPRRRYATAEELAQELDRFLHHQPIVARPLGVTERLWRWCRRSPAEALLFAIVAFVVVQFLVLNLILMPLLGGKNVDSLVSYSRGVTSTGLLGASIGSFVAVIRCRRKRIRSEYWPRHFIAGAIIGFLISAGIAVLSEEVVTWAREKFRSLQGKQIM